MLTTMFISVRLMNRTKLIVLQHFRNKERRRNLILNSQTSLISYPSSQKSSLKIQTAEGGVTACKEILGIT